MIGFHTRCIGCHEYTVAEGMEAAIGEMRRTPDELFDQIEAMVAAGYMDAMHGLCIDCHKEKEAELGRPHHHECATCHVDGDPAGVVDGITVGPAADRRKGDRSGPLFDRQLQARAITGGEQFRLVAIAAVPDRPDRVNHIAGRQSEPGGDPVGRQPRPRSRAVAR